MVIRMPEKLKEKVWKDFMKTIERHRKINKKYIKKEGDIIPHLNVYTYCPGCDEISISTALFGMEMRFLRENFQIFLLDVLMDSMICDKCGDITIPLGYTWDSLAWMVPSKDEEEIRRYIRVVGTLEYHPKRKEIYVTTVVTTFGKNFTVVEEVKRNGNKIIFGKKVSSKKVLGKFVVDLPKIADEIWNDLEERGK